MNELSRRVGKVVMVKLPSNKRPRFRWIVRKREDGRFIVRTPKTGVLIRELKYKNDYDFGPPHLLEKGSSLYKPKFN